MAIKVYVAVSHLMLANDGGLDTSYLSWSFARRWLVAVVAGIEQPLDLLQNYRHTAHEVYHAPLRKGTALDDALLIQNLEITR